MSIVLIQEAKRLQQLAGLISENQLLTELNDAEQDVKNAILGTSLKEVKFSPKEILSKMLYAAKKGILTTAIISSVLASCNFDSKTNESIKDAIEKSNYEVVDSSEVSQIKDETAAVIIGDNALEQRNKSKYFYDLAGEWKKFTDLPFVFATWVANKKLDDDFVALFNEANKSGIENIDEILKQLHFSYYDLKTYFTKNISYNFDEEKKMGMNLFLKMMTEERLPEEIINV